MASQESLKHPMNGQSREKIKIGLEVEVILKADQKTEKLTRGVVAEILTSSEYAKHVVCHSFVRLLSCMFL